MNQHSYNFPLPFLKNKNLFLHSVILQATIQYRRSENFRIKNISLVKFKFNFRRPSLSTKIKHGQKLDTGEKLALLLASERAPARSHKCGRDLCIHGYHIYKAIRRAVVGETLACEKEPRNIHDRYMCSSCQERQKLHWYLPRIVSRVYSFMRRGGNIHCTVSGMRRYFADLQQTFSSSVDMRKSNN